MSRTIRRSVGTRLVVLALVPTLGFLTVGGITVVAAQGDAETSAELDEHIATITDLMELAFAVGDEEFPLLAQQQVTTFGITVEQASSLLGFDLRERGESAQGRSDGLIAGLDDHVDRTSTVELLERARATAGDPTMSSTDVRRAFEAADAGIQEALATEIVHLDDLLGRSSPSQDLLAAIDELMWLNRVVAQTNRQLPLLFDVVLSIFTEEMSGRPLADLTAVTGWYDEEATVLDATLEGVAGERWRAMRADPAVVQLENTIARVTRAGAEAIDVSDTAALAGLATVGFGREEQHIAVFQASARRASELAAADRADSRRDATVRALLLVVTLGATVVLVVIVARSISRPLRRLASAATALTQGDLDSAAETGDGGPSEVEVVRSAFDDLVANVTVFDAQADALAHNRLDDPALALPVAGRLGASLQLSVAHLSQTMAERERLHAELVHQATHDSLTGLANRAAAQFGLDGAVGRARRSGDAVAVLFIDLDDFKRMNDTFGHAAGDDVLIEVARRLRSVVRSDSLVARLGGDEFLVVVEGESVAHLLELGERLIIEVNRPIDVAGSPVRVGASVGVAVLDHLGESAADLLRSADIAAYRAKSSGRGRVELFDDRLRHEIDRIAHLETDVADALASGALRYALQPVWRMDTRRLAGFEALVRWTRADGSEVLPDDFIPVAESSDLVIAIDNFVMNAAAREVAGWGSDVSLSVNISGRHLLDRRVVDDVRAVLDESGLDPSHLIIEITETVLVSDTALAIRHLDAVRALGVRVAIDDFGSGYASLAHLRRLPIDVLKIDQLFVAELLTTGDSRLLRVVIEAAHGLGLSVVAEGVEMDEQLAVLEELGCEEVQGYLLGRPIPPAEAAALVRASTSSR
jgi:diguanylate cyclase (GGDEF)-like protein